MDGATAKRRDSGSGQLDHHKRNNLPTASQDFFKFPTTPSSPRPSASADDTSKPRSSTLTESTGSTTTWNDDQSKPSFRTAGVGHRTKPANRRAEIETALGLHSNAECMTCHMARSGRPGFPSTVHRHQDVHQRSATESTGRRIKMGLLKEAEKAHWLKNERLQKQARAYLHANCAHCHRRGADGPFELRADMPLDRMQLFDVKPNQGTCMSIRTRHQRRPATVRPPLSHGLHRGGHMPKLGARTVDPGLKLTCDWIAELGHDFPEPLKARPPQIYQDTGKSLQYATPCIRQPASPTSDCPRPSKCHPTFTICLNA